MINEQKLLEFLNKQINRRPRTPAYQSELVTKYYAFLKQQHNRNIREIIKFINKLINKNEKGGDNANFKTNKKSTNKRIASSF